MIFLGGFDRLHRPGTWWRATAPVILLSAPVLPDGYENQNTDEEKNGQANPKPRNRHPWRAILFITPIVAIILPVTVELHRNTDGIRSTLGHSNWAKMRAIWLVFSSRTVLKIPEISRIVCWLWITNIKIIKMSKNWRKMHIKLTNLFSEFRPTPSNGRLLFTRGARGFHDPNPL